MLMFKTNHFKKSFIPLLGSVLLLGSIMGINFSANASLLITPTKVEFSQRDRSAKVSLVNTSNETKTYKVFFREQYQGADGSYKGLTAEQADFPVASSMMRYSPKQVTLAPGERQHVRIALRRPKDLADGEYRSHMVFEALPNLEKLKKMRGKETGIKMYVNLAFSIPIIVRQGEYNTNIALSKVSLFDENIEGEQHAAVDIEFSRSGLHSAIGTIKVYWQGKSDFTEKQIAMLNNVAIYRERDLRHITLRFKDHKIEDGIMRIEYLGVDDLKGQTFVNQKLKVSRNDYKKRTPTK